MSTLAPFIVKLWDINATTRGRGTLQAVFEDAKDIGVSAYANQGGEMFMTIPWNHPQVSQILPWQRHYEVTRYNPATGNYEFVGAGLLDDFESDANEIIAYGTDYLGALDLSISAATTSYTSTLIGTIISAQLSSATTASNSITKFVNVGTIDATTQTVTVLTSYQPRLQFIQQLIDIWQSDSSVRPIISVDISTSLGSTVVSVNFSSNKGSDQLTRLYEWGGLVNDFRYSAGYKDFATYGYSLGQKREGASILFSTQSYASPVDFGRIERATVFLDVVNQAALDRKAKRFARKIGTPERAVSFGLRVNKVGPWEWGSFGDSIPVRIDRGLVQTGSTGNTIFGVTNRTDIDYSLYTVWGQEWIGKKNGSEDLFLSVAVKEL